MANEVVINVKANTEKAKGGLEGMRSAMKKVGMAATVAGAAIVGFGVASLKSFSEAGDEVHKMALRTGFSTEALSELRVAAELSGTSLGALETGVRRMQMSITDASRGVKLSTDAFDALGISVDSIQHLSPEEQFNQMTLALAEIEDVSLRTKTAMDLFGRAGTALLPMLAGGEEGLNAMKQKAHELGVVFDQEAANKAARLSDAMGTMKGSMSGVMMVVAEELAPVISSLAENIEVAVSKVSKWADANPGLTKVIVLVVGALGAFLAVLGPLFIAISMITTIAPVVGAAFTLMMGPIGLIIIAVVALAAAWATNFGNIRGITESVVNAVIGMINFMIRGINSIKIPDWVPGIGGKSANLSEIPMVDFTPDEWKGNGATGSAVGETNQGTTEINNLGNMVDENSGRGTHMVVDLAPG